MLAPPMVLAVLGLRPTLHPCTDELRKRVQSIRVRSLQEVSGRGSGSGSGSGDSVPWRNRQHASNDTHSNRWRQDSQQSIAPIRFTNGSSGSLSSLTNDRSPRYQNTSYSPISPNTPTSTPVRYISRFHNGSKTGDDQILNTVILNKLNIFSVKTYEDVKLFLFQILGSDQKEFIRDFTWLVFRKAAAEDKFCALFAKLLCEIKQVYPVILEEMRNLHTTYLDIWDASDSSETKVDRRCRLGYSQFLAELTALGVLESDTMKKTLETLKSCIIRCLYEERYQETVEEYMDCLRQLCGSKVPKDVRVMIREMLLSDLDKWISETKISAPGLSTKSRFACMDLKDHLMR